MAGQRHRTKPKLRPSSSPDAGAVIVVSSTDDEEANRDLSLEIVEKSRKREAKRKRAAAAPAPMSVIDLSSASSDEAAAAAAAAAPCDPAVKKSKKMKKKKKKAASAEEEEDGDAGFTFTDIAPEEAPAKEKSTDTAPEEVPATDKEVEATGTADSVITEVAEAAVDNEVLRKLLRIPRYFDLPGDKIVESCYNCGEEGHRAVDCGMERRQRPCFVCGMFGHVAKQCTQGQDCYICKRRGHVAKNCPDKGKLNSQDSIICLRCGDIGHDISSCRNDYAPDDLKEIQCYICKKYGHLCCVNLTFPAPEEVSCYNCARSGHVGLGCAKQKQSGETSNLAPPPLCYKCGEAGHLARGCRTTKSTRWKSESSTPKRFPKKKRDSPGFKSLPHDIGKTQKRKHLRHDGWKNTTPQKSRSKGGWSVDDSSDQPDLGNTANTWRSPRTPVGSSPKGRSRSYSRSYSGSQGHWKDNSYSGSGYNQNSHASTSGYNQNSHASTSAYQHEYSDSRYSSQGHRRWKS